MSTMSGNERRQPTCPTCAAVLTLATEGVHGWACAAGHGMAATLPVARLQADSSSLGRLWFTSAQASPGPRACPFCTAPMVSVDVSWDHTSVASFACAPTPAAGLANPITLDLCRLDEIIWFDAGELANLPPQSASAQPDNEPLLTNPLADAASALGEHDLHPSLHSIMRGAYIAMGMH